MLTDLSYVSKKSCGNIHKLYRLWTTPSSQAQAQIFPVTKCPTHPSPENSTKPVFCKKNSTTSMFVANNQMKQHTFLKIDHSLAHNWQIVAPLRARPSFAEPWLYGWWLQLSKAEASSGWNQEMRSPLGQVAAAEPRKYQQPLQKQWQAENRPEMSIVSNPSECRNSLRWSFKPIYIEKVALIQFWY